MVGSCEHGNESSGSINWGNLVSSFHRVSSLVFAFISQLIHTLNTGIRICVRNLKAY
jgi:hypothetical protein